jgi:serine/threonine protein phosphatase PrpC
VDGFAEADDEIAQRRPAGGGTTATLVLAAGWELLVASAGDSLAVLDTGSEVVLVRPCRSARVRVR